MKKPTKSSRFLNEKRRKREAKRRSVKNVVIVKTSKRNKIKAIIRRSHR